MAPVLLAVLVGCNYPATTTKLSGSYNDVNAMKKVLVDQFNADPSNIKSLLDNKTDNDTYPSAVLIKDTLKAAADKARPGDHLFFHFSGRGKLINSNKAALVCRDFDTIDGNDILDAAKSAKKNGAHFTILADCCHSEKLIIPDQLPFNLSAFCSCRYDEERAEITDPNASTYGAFSYGVLQALNGSSLPIGNKTVFDNAKKVVDNLAPGEESPIYFAYPTFLG